MVLPKESVQKIWKTHICTLHYQLPVLSQPPAKVNDIALLILDFNIHVHHDVWSTPSSAALLHNPAQHPYTLVLSCVASTLFPGLSPFPPFILSLSTILLLHFTPYFIFRCPLKKQTIANLKVTATKQCSCLERSKLRIRLHYDLRV